MYGSPCLEVRFRKQLVGWLTDFDGSENVKAIKLEVNSLSFDEDTGVAETFVDERTFILKEMEFSYSPFETLDDPEGFRAKLNALPCYAIKHLEPDMDINTVRWLAVMLDSFEDYEFVFEYGNFKPADTEEDHALVIAEKLAGPPIKIEWMAGTAIVKRESCITTDLTS